MTRKKLNLSLINVANILSDGAYHDGTTIGVTLGMTRSAIWKTIKRLQAYRIQINSIKGKGYALQESLQLLEPNKIQALLPDKKISLQVFESIDSTNAYLKTIKNATDIKVCLAEQQTLGKGRLNREWYSPFGQNLYFSCLYTFKKDISELAGLSLVTSLAIIKTLQSFGMTEKLNVKWPNDILCAGKKIAGGLIEIQAETHGVSVAVIGIGINVNMLADNEEISQAWTSMRQVLKQSVDRNKLVASLITHLLDYLQRFNLHGFTQFVTEWNTTDCLTDQQIEVKNVNHKVLGTVLGVNELGQLLMHLEDGRVQAFSSGDTTIVKKFQV